MDAVSSNDLLVQRVKGRIKTDNNRILNAWFDRNTDLSRLVVERLDFQNPNLSRRLNRLIGNFGQNVFNAKQEEYSKPRGFLIDRNNPTYTSQEVLIAAT